ncbi:MAG: hypothetical protein WCO78_03455 [Candidatus Roizmanbacteria bacterium]
MKPSRDWIGWSLLFVSTFCLSGFLYAYSLTTQSVETTNVLGVEDPPVSPSVTPTPTPSLKQLKLEAYFAYRKKLNGQMSPLASHSALLVSEAEKYGIDYRYVTTIATIESNQCQATPDRDPYNCWGWGIYPGSFKVPFTDYADGIQAVTRGLAKNYHRKGFDTIEDIAAIYNPNTPEAWAAKIHKIFDLIESM